MRVPTSIIRQRGIADLWLVAIAVIVLAGIAIGILHALSVSVGPEESDNG